ncbi:MAG: LlaJI family restriction endonuclease [Bacteroidota bacterium]
MFAIKHHLLFVEDEYLQPLDFHSSLNNDNELISNLFELSYLKQNEKGFWAFQFVGVIVSNGTIICVLPKYYHNKLIHPEDAFGDFIKIYKVLKSFGSEDSDIPDCQQMSNIESLNNSEIVLAEKFLKDYFEYGIFIKSKNHEIVMSDGDTNWTKTVDLMHPYFSRGAPFYNDKYSDTSITEETNLITQTHKWILKYCSEKYGELLDFSYSVLFDCPSEIYSISSIQGIIIAIDREMRETFIDWEIRLLKRMKLFLEKLFTYNENEYSIFGTGYFNQIWEKTCSTIFANQIQSFRDQIPFPLWNDLTGHSIMKETLKPDIIATYKGEFDALFIFDAKYYNIILKHNPRFDILSNPGIEDIGKQFLYNKAFEKAPFVYKFNCFLFPNIQHPFFDIFGSIEFDLFQNQKIFNIYISANKVFDSYLQGGEIGVENLMILAKTIIELQDNSAV